MKNKKIVLLPLINLRSGLCPFCYSLDKKNIYSESVNPVNLCFLLQKGNAQTLIIQDLDSFEGLDNTNNLNAIISIAKSLHIRVNAIGNFKYLEECRLLLNNDIHRIIIDELIIKDNYGVRKLLEDYSNSRIAVRVNSYNNTISFSKLNYRSGLLEFLKIIKELNITRIFYYEKEWEDFNDIDLTNIKKISDTFNFSITIAGGINNSKTLINFMNKNYYNVDSIMIDDALFHSNFPCQRIWRFN